MTPHDQTSTSGPAYSLHCRREGAQRTAQLAMAMDLARHMSGNQRGECRFGTVNLSAWRKETKTGAAQRGTHFPEMTSGAA